MVLRRYTLLYLILLCLLILPFSVHAQSESDCDSSLDFDAYTNRGLEAFNAGNLEGALAEARCAQAADPERPLGYYNIGFLLGELGEPEEALEYFGEAIRLNPDYRSAYLNRAEVYSSLQRYEEAIADYDLVLEFEQTASTYNLRGIAYFNLEDYESAEANFTEAMALDSSDAIFPRNRASSRFRMERYDEAYEDYQIASQLAPDWEVPVFGMADALYSAQRYREALVHYRDGITRFGTNNARDTRIRRISVIRSGDFIDNRVVAESGSITTDTIFQLLQLDKLEGDAIANINGLAITPNGAIIASSDESGIVSLWDAEGDALTPIDIGGSVKNLITSPDSAFLALVADDERVVLISTVSQAVVGEWDGGDAGSAALQGIAFSPDGGLLAGVWEDGSIRIYDPYIRARVGSLAQAEAISATTAIEFSPNGRYITIALENNSVQLWDVLDSVLAVTWVGAEEAIHTLAFEPSGARLFAGTDEAVYYWVTSDPVVVQIPSSGMVSDILFSPDTLLMLTAGENLTIYDAETVEAIAEVNGEDGAWSAVAFSPDGNRLLAAQSGGEAVNPLAFFEPFTPILEIDPADYETIASDNLDAMAMLVEIPLNKPRGAIWSADGDTLFVGTETGVVQFPLDGSAAELAEQPSGSFAIYDGAPIFQTIEIDANDERTLVVYDAEDFEAPLLRYEVGDTTIRSFVYGDDMIALATHPEDGRIISEIVRLPDGGGEPEIITRGGTELSTGMAIRSDGLSAVAPREFGSETGPMSIELYNPDGTHSGSINAPIPYLNFAGNVQYSFVEHIAFSPDNRLMAVGSFPTVIRIWQEIEPGQWEAIANLKPPEGGGRTVFSPSGAYLLCGGDEEIVVWHIEDEDGRAHFTEVGRIPAAVGIGQGTIAFNANETLIAIITDDGTVQIWGSEE